MDYAGQDLYEICLHNNNAFIFQDEKYFKTVAETII